MLIIEVFFKHDFFISINSLLMNENEFFVLKKYIFDKPFTTEIDSIIDSFF